LRIPYVLNNQSHRVAELLPIRDRLAKTDWLIDQVVYRLYGLTKDEIKVVEGER